MRKISYFLASVALTLGVMNFAAGSAHAAGAVAGKPIYAAGGKRLGVVYRVTSDGSAQIIINGKLVTIPASTITENGSKIETSVDRAAVIAAR
jgi:hypothetical protein